jgi:hypothetical protein
MRYVCTVTAGGKNLSPPLVQSFLYSQTLTQKLTVNWQDSCRFDWKQMIELAARAVNTWTDVANNAFTLGDCHGNNNSNFLMKWTHVV